MKKTYFLFIFILLLSGNIFAQYETYRVEKEKTVAELADKFKVSKETLLKLNPDLKDGKVANKTIIIPPRESTESTTKASRIRFKEYKVKPKETLYSLAKRNNITVDDIKKYNPYLYEKELGEYDLIKIPIFEEEIKNFNSSVQTSTFENLLHIVTPKETKYGISKHYGMTVEQLDSLNPFIKELQPGQVLKVTNPNSIKKEKEDQFDYYEVKPKETLYSLTKKLNIAQDSLEKLNPILKELGLQAGMQLRVPNASGSDLSTEFKLSNKLDLSKEKKLLTQQNIAVLLPFNLHKIEEEEEEESIKKDGYLQISLDLYSGIKMAMEDAQAMGISIRAKVYDTQISPQKIDQILGQNNFDQTHLVIGPLLPGNIEKVAKELKNKDIAIFSPLANGELKGSDKIFQSRPPAGIKEQVLLNYLKANQDGKNFMILGDAKHQAFTKQILSGISNSRMIQQAKAAYLDRADLTKLLSKDQPNWVIIETDDLGAINNSISHLNAMRKDYEIRIFTSDKGKINDAEVQSEYLSHLNFTYASVDKSDTSTEENSFVKKYVQKYGITPSSYVIRGYDVTLDAILRTAVNNNDFTNHSDMKGYTEYVENRFDYKAKTFNGFFNNAVYLIQFDENLQLKVIN